jgi:molybdopterin-biosynthesis enzyme MoeA-like protein
MKSTVDMCCSKVGVVFRSGGLGAAWDGFGLGEVSQVIEWSLRAR